MLCRKIMDSGPDLIDLREKVATTTLEDHGSSSNRVLATPSTATANSSRVATDDVVTKMDLDSSAPPDLGNMYNQCKLARESATTTGYTCFEPGTAFRTGTAKTTRIGNLNMVGDQDVTKTFHGARICKGSKVVNECISMSFDPRNLMCIGCNNNHKLGENGRLVICFADQNMVPFITDGEGGCIAIVRLENASLSDMIDLSFEVLEKFTPPPGSIILYGSASHLYRVGASLYARDWVDSLTRIGARWRNINVCPLVPFIRENCPGIMA
jgi:hypothetical protein